MSDVYEGRVLSPDEARVLGAILSLDFRGALELREQMPFARVVGRCRCGCATVDLAVDHSVAEPARGVRSPIPAEAEVRNEDEEHLGGIIVFLKDGYLSLLEVYSFGDR